MKKSSNQSYNRIIEYLKNVKDISDVDKRYLFYYATQLYKNNVENIEDEGLNDIFCSLKQLIVQLKNMEDTSIARSRINEILDILQEVSSSNVDEETIIDISYRLDKLFCDTDMPLRDRSSLSYNLGKGIKGVVKRGAK